MIFGMHFPKTNPGGLLTCFRHTDTPSLCGIYCKSQQRRHKVIYRLPADLHSRGEFLFKISLQLFMKIFFIIIIY